MNWITLFAVLVPLLALATPSLACDCAPALKLNGDNIVEYGRSEGSPKPLNAVTACFWTDVTNEYALTHRPTPVSYAIPDVQFHGNEFMIMFWRQKLNVFVRNHKTEIARFRFLDGKLHHVCVTWENAIGQIKVYVDGHLGKSMMQNGFEPGEPIRPGGLWVIGQDQDIKGNDFKLKDSLKGLLTEVNIWDRVLCPSDIARVAKGCGPLIQGNYKSYRDFIPSAAVEFTDAPCCPGGSHDE